jgi:hypothetical protein
VKGLRQETHFNNEGDFVARIIFFFSSPREWSGRALDLDLTLSLCATMLV